MSGGSCAGSSGAIDLEKDIVEPVMQLLDPSTGSHDDSGYMYDYGHTKSDSYEGKMTKAKLFRMGQMAQSLHDRLDDQDDLPEWLNNHVTTAEDRLRSAYDYMEYQILSLIHI